MKEIANIESIVRFLRSEYLFRNLQSIIDTFTPTKEITFEGTAITAGFSNDNSTLYFSKGRHGIGQISILELLTNGTNVSEYKNAMDSTGTGGFPFADIIERIKSTKYKATTDTLRELEGEQASNYKKKNFSCVTWSGTFAPSRAKKNLQVHTGIICIDIDKLPTNEFESVNKVLQADKYTFVSFVSPSGNGVKILVNLESCKDETTHLQYFIELEKYYFYTYNLQIDKSCKNVDRLCFLPHDENLFINEQANPFVLPESVQLIEQPTKGEETTKVFAELQKPYKNLAKTEPTQAPSQPTAFTWCIEQIEKSEIFAQGNRNNFINRLAWYANEKGVNFETCLSESLSRYASETFTADEINQVVKSVYSTHQDKHNSLPYTETKPKKETQRRPETQKEVFAKLNPLLLQFLDKVTKVNFYNLADIKFIEKEGVKKPERNLREKDYKVLSIEEILNLAKVQNWNLCTKYNNIYIFTGKYWQVIDKNDFSYFLQKCSEKLGVPIITAKDADFADKLFKQFLSIAYLPTPDINTDTVLINLMNGTFEISQKKTILRDFQADDFLTYILPFEFEPTATAPIFQSYLDKVLPDKSLQHILAEFVGYVFTKNLKLEKALFLLGGGSNGKSVFYEVINALVGSNNTANYSIKSLTGQTNQYYLANLPKFLLNYASEFKEIQDFDIFKKLVSCEDIEARMPYGEPFTFRNQCKMILNSNGMPKDIEQNEAYFRRLLIIPFDVEIQEHEKDVDLPSKIIGTELSGVFNWVLEGLQRLLSNRNFTKSEKVLQTVQDYKNSSDTVHTFLEEKAYKPHATEFKILQEVYTEYRVFCNDIGGKPLQRGNFRERLEKKHKVLIGNRVAQGTPVYIANCAF